MEDQVFTRIPEPPNSIWNDLDNGKTYQLNNETGEMILLQRNGEYILEYDANLTGQIGYKERIQKAQGKRGLLPFPVDHLQFNPKKAFYTPQNDKFEGYSQFANPVTLPYYNQEQKYKNDRKKKRFIQEIQEKMNCDSIKNEKVLKEYKGYKRHNLGVSHLTGTYNNLQEILKNNNHTVKVLNERKITQEIEIPLEENTVKIINDRKIQNPNIQTFVKTLKKTQSVPQIQSEGTKGFVSEKIHIERFQQKIQSLEQKTQSFQLLPKQKLAVIQNFDLSNWNENTQPNIIRPPSQNEKTQTPKEKFNRTKGKTVSSFQLGKVDDNLVMLGRQTLKSHQGLKDEFWKSRNSYLEYWTDDLIRMEKKKLEKLDQEVNRRNLLKVVLQETLSNNLKQESEKCKKAWGIK